MASRSLGVLSIDLVAKTGGFEAGLDKAARTADRRMKEIERRAKQFGAVLGTALAAGAGLAVNELRKAIDNMDELSKAAQRVSLPTEQFSGLVYAGKLADVEVNTLVTSLGRLTKAQADAERSTSEQARVFDALKIATKDAEGNLRNSIEVLYDFADAFQRQEGSPEIVAAGIKIFGRSFQEMIPLIKDGSDGLRGAAEEAEAFGQIIGTDTGRAAEAFNDNISRMQMLVSGLANAVAAELLPDLQQLTDEWVASAKEGDGLTSTARDIADAIRSVVEWMREGTAVGASFRESMGALRETIGAGAANIAGIFKMDDKQIDQSRKDFFEAGGRFWDAAWNGVEEQKKARPIQFIEPADLMAQDAKAVAQMRAAAAEAERLRKLAFGDRPKTGAGGGSKGGKSDAQREAEQAIKDAQRAREELERQVQAVADAREEFDGYAAQLAGPMAAANYQFAVEQERLNELAREGEISTERLAEAQANLRKEHEANVESIRKQLDPVGELIKDYEFENELMRMGNEERELAIALRYADAAATDEQLAKLRENIRANRELAESIELQDGFRDSFAGFFEDVIGGTKSVGDAFRDMLDDINRMILQRISENWVEQLFGASGTSGGGSSGGWLEMFAGLFSGGKAGGGWAAANSLYEVNERGMEMASVNGRDYLLTGNKPVEITPNNRLQSAGGGVTQNFYSPRFDTKQTPAQLAQEARIAQQLAMRNA